MRAGSLHAVVLAWAGVLGSACRSDDVAASRERAPIIEPADTRIPSPDPPLPTLALNSYARPSADELAAAQVALQTHVAAGRAALEAKHDAIGITHLQQACVINPMRAALLGELGVAYLGANKLDEATRALEQALHHARDQQIRGELLYDLGRVAEARGDVPLASEHYANSLAVRSNDAAAARLSALTGGMEVVSHTPCGWVEHGPAPQQLCRAYGQTLADLGALPACVYERTYELELDADAEIAVFSYLDPVLSREVFVLNAVLGGVWFSTELTWVDHPQVLYADENLGELELHTEQLAPGGLPEIVIEWTLHGHAIDPGDNTQSSWSSTRLGVLMLHSGSPRWLIGFTRASSHSHGEIGSTEAHTDETSVEFEWLTKTGEIELRASAREPSAPLGRFALGAAPQLCPAQL